MNMTKNGQRFRSYKSKNWLLREWVHVVLEGRRKPCGVQVLSSTALRGTKGWGTHRERENQKKFLSRGCIICPLFPGYNVYMSRRTQQRTWDGTNKITMQMVFYGTHQMVKHGSILTALILSLLLTLAMLDLDCVPTGSALSDQV